MCGVSCGESPGVNDPIDEAIARVKAMGEELESLRRFKRDCFIAMGRYEVAERMYGDVKDD